MNPYENDPREPIKEWEGIVEEVECGGCESTILSAYAVFGGYANGSSDACWACPLCDTENTTVFEAVEVNAEIGDEPVVSEYSTCRECEEDYPTSDLNDFMVCYVCDHLCDEGCSDPCSVKVGACAHEGTMGTIDLETEMVICDDCGYAEPADPDDIANHKSLRDTGIGIY